MNFFSAITPKSKHGFPKGALTAAFSACLPKKTLLKVVGPDKQDVDIIAN